MNDAQVPPQKPSYKRKIILINPAFQLRVLLFFGGISVVTILSFYGAIEYFFYKFNLLGSELGLPPTHIFFQFINDQQNLMRVIFLLISALVLTFLIASGLMLSHRVAGPLYRLNKYLNQIADGQPVTPVAFRKKDFFQELATATNRALGRVK